MPLVARIVPAERLTMPDGDWYEIKTMLSWFEREQSAPINGFKLQMPYGKTKKDLQDDEMVDVVPNTASASLRKLALYLAGWSHPEPCNSEYMRRIPKTHFDLIMERIEQLETLQDGPTVTSEVGKSSNGSSGPTLSTANPSD